MPSEVATPQSSVEQPVSSSAAGTVSPSSSDYGEPETSISSPAGAPEGSIGDNSDGDAPRELSPQDFDSLEDYAQALIEKKQTALGNQQSSDDQQDPELVEEGSAQLTEGPGSGQE